MKIEIDYSELTNSLKELQTNAVQQGYKALADDSKFNEWIKDYVESSVYELFEEYDVEVD